MRHAIIMAGGAGVRLWPLSRRSRPKQVLPLFGGRSLLRQSFERVATMLSAEQVYVITLQRHLPVVAKELPEIPPANLFGEPVGRDTASTVGLASAVVASRDPEAVLGMFTADHLINPLERFRATVERAYEIAEQRPDTLVTMGVRPNRPDTNYGYIKRGERIHDGVYEVSKFTEKPTVAKAIKYLAEGEYYWNSGMFAWRAATILDQLRRHLPATHDAVTKIAGAWADDRRTQLLESIYPGLMKISIDFAVMEKAPRVAVVELDCHWVDVGSWPVLDAVIGADSEGNVSAAEHVIHLGSRGNIVVAEGKHLIATIGIDDLVIVHSPDATLVCTRRDAQSIKELVDNVRQRFGEDFV